MDDGGLQGGRIDNDQLTRNALTAAKANCSLGNSTYRSLLAQHFATILDTDGETGIDQQMADFVTEVAAFLDLDAHQLVLEIEAIVLDN